MALRFKTRREYEEFLEGLEKSGEAERYRGKLPSPTEVFGLTKEEQKVKEQYLAGERPWQKKERREAERKAKEEREKLEELERIPEKVGGKAIGLVSTPVRWLVAGAKQVKPMLPKGIKHPDALVKNRELYFGRGGGIPDEFTPLGRQITDWRELYFGTGPVQKDAAKVLNALMAGATDINTISIYTGLDERRIEGSLKFLKRQGYDVEYIGD